MLVLSLLSKDYLSRYVFLYSASSGVLLLDRFGDCERLGVAKCH